MRKYYTLGELYLVLQQEVRMEIIILSEDDHTIMKVENGIICLLHGITILYQMTGKRFRA